MATMSLKPDALPYSLPFCQISGADDSRDGYINSEGDHGAACTSYGFETHTTVENLVTVNH